MNGLPKGWVSENLGAFGEVYCGQSSTASDVNTDGRGTPYVTGPEQWTGTAIELNKWTTTPKRVVPDGCIFITVKGAGVGKMFPGVSCAIGRDVYAYRPSPQLSYRFVAKALAYTVNAVIREARGDIPGLSKEHITDHVVPLPPLAEQMRIVAKMDALNEKSARARAELARIESLVEQMRVITLQSAFNGRLTSDIYPDFIAVQTSEEAPLVAPWSIPDHWIWRRTDQVGFVGLGRQRSPKNHDGPNMRPYLRSANITWHGVDMTDVKTMNFDSADFERFKLKAGDVLLNEGSGSAKEVGKPAIWRGELQDCCYQNTLLRVQPRLCTSEYLYFYFLFTAMTGRFVSSTQGVNIQHIGREGLARYPVPLAPGAEQRKIVRRIESAFAKIDRLEADARRALRLLGKLDEAILARAFRGELVPQDESDEPANLLLERILAEREGAPKSARRKQAKGNVSEQIKNPERKMTMAMSRSDVALDHLAQTLRANGGTSSATDLWLRSEMDIDEFYKQLRSEIDSGQIREGTEKDELVLVNAR
ncbi:hypothetical protein HFO33_22280 [Rhizobium leguminosarum]|uniref:restriction endonuclease subunit S n=1 Tax=Rhizobium leguminosarum TaxID=384 RepID=UPI001C97A6F9|nr:restriction endonuclease subunit S [Rhizobium leguminosarum]MBY5719286.1 hypothetical protein [Rhizobium leguminosarum]